MSLSVALVSVLSLCCYNEAMAKLGKLYIVNAFTVNDENGMAIVHNKPNFKIS